MSKIHEQIQAKGKYYFHGKTLVIDHLQHTCLRSNYHEI